ncbi:permease of the major facilitator superfamily [Candidatus Scalindua japonica]|uniref:Permease of the major facilitator superfamily n=1 Tax=Candidatus Scalindua japonica TaxID=1284222 RepID=A0A286TVL8_9BACT|nr:permease of the major facilitator superfamily [Candidatus Scalindua japonica]
MPSKLNFLKKKLFQESKRMTEYHYRYPGCLSIVSILLLLDEAAIAENKIGNLLYNVTSHPQREGESINK